MRQNTRRDTDSHVSGAWLTRPSDIHREDQISPYLWRFRHKSGRAWGQFPHLAKKRRLQITRRGVKPEIEKQINDLS